MASIVTRSPGCAVAATAFVELTLAVDLFEKAAVTTQRARSGLVSIHTPGASNLVKMNALGPIKKTSEESTTNLLCIPLSRN